MTNIYERLRALEDKGAFTCTGDCRHCPYYHAINYTYRGCDVYYVLERNGIELSTEDCERLAELESECTKLNNRCCEISGKPKIDMFYSPQN